MLNAPAVQTQPGVVKFDFDDYKKWLLKEVEKYDTVVTEDNLKDSKKMATELNKLSSAIASGMKPHIDKLKQPSVELRDKSKELQAICQEARARINEQVNQYESKRAQKAAELIAEYVDMAREEIGVDSEYRTNKFDDHAKISALNAKGESLTKAAKDAIESVVKEEKSLQLTVEGRVSQLESESYKAGLKSPLTIDHVRAFVRADKDTWESNMQAMIAREVERQQQVLESVQPQPQPEPEKKPEPVQNNDGTKTVTVTVKFSVRVGSSVPESAVVEKVGTRLNEAGFDWDECHA